MIIVFHPHIHLQHPDFELTLTHLRKLPGIEVIHQAIKGLHHTILSVYLIGDTFALSKENLAALPGVSTVLQISSEYPKLGRKPGVPVTGFDYRGLHFSQESFHVFAGLCAVDTPAYVEAVMKALQAHGQVTTRMGAYKPRTNPYSFQGLGKTCLPMVFELAGKYGIQVIAMEVTHERQVDEIHDCLSQLGNPTGVMLQIGTRNAQNFELLKAVGSQNTYPILYKRGYGITLQESLNAAEYLAAAGNTQIIFCLRGMKSLGSHPHRNLVDFAQVPVIKRLTQMPVCVDPSHAVGDRSLDPTGISDVFHATAQGVISGANMVLADIHPSPAESLVDGRQAVRLSDFTWWLEDIKLAREAYLKRLALRQAFTQSDTKATSLQQKPEEVTIKENCLS